MRRNIMIYLFLALYFNSAKGQNPPTVQDLDFLIGTWDISFVWYDTHIKDSDPVLTETGSMTCSYDLDYRGTKKFIFCKFCLTADSGRLKGRYRETLEVIQWSRFSNRFERTGVYSNWPSTGFETFVYDSAGRAFQAEGELGVQDDMLERYAAIHQFNEDYTEFTRRNVANFSDMPITEFNLTMTCLAKKQ